jgi:hypothetical protein
MPLYVIERNFAEQLEVTRDDATQVALVNAEVGVNWMFSFLSMDEKKTYCLYEQKLRSFSHPLQRWQWDLSALEDEMPLQVPPHNSLIQPFTLHHKVGHETQRDVMLVGTRRRLDRSGSAPRVAHLTGLQAQLALQYPDHCFHLVALAVMPPDLFSGQAQPVGHVIFAAVSHHKYFEATRQVPNGVPVRLLEIPAEWLALKAPMLLHLADKVPPVIP